MPVEDMGYRIRKQLDVIGKSQRQLAEEIDISEVSLSRYIAGNREPRGKLLLKLANALGTTTDYLLGTDVNGDFNEEYLRIKTWIDLNAGKMTTEQKTKLIGCTFKDV